MALFRAGSLVKIGGRGAFGKRIKRGRGVGHVRLKGYPDDPFLVPKKKVRRRGSQRQVVAPEDRFVMGIGKEEVRVGKDFEVPAGKTFLKLDRQGNWIGSPPQAGSPTPVRNVRVKEFRQPQLYTAEDQKRFSQRYKVSRASRRQRIKDSGSIYGDLPTSKGSKRDPSLARSGMSSTFTLGAGRGRGVGMTTRTIHRPVPVRVKPQLEPTKTQEALVALRQAGREEPEKAMMNMFDPGQDQYYGRLNERKLWGTQERYTVPHDYPIRDAERIATEQAALPEGERTLFPESGHISPVKHLKGMEGGQPIFEQRRYQKVGQIAETASQAVKAVQKTTPIATSLLKDRAVVAVQMWKAMGGMRTLNGKMWKRNRQLVFRTRNPKGSAEDAFMKVAIEWMNDKNKASNKYPKALINSVEEAFEIYKGSID